MSVFYSWLGRMAASKAVCTRPSLVLGTCKVNGKNTCSPLPLPLYLNTNLKKILGHQVGSTDKGTCCLVILSLIFENHMVVEERIPSSQ